MTERQRLNEPFIAWCDRQCVQPDSDAWLMFEDAHSIGELTASNEAGGMLAAICDMLELPRTDQGGFCTDIAAYEQAIKALSHVPPAEQHRQDEARKMLARLHNEGILSEGQAAKATGLGRIELRKLCDELNLEAPSNERLKRDLDLIRFAHQCDMEGEENGTGYPIAETVLKRFENGEWQG
jgi:hypothetical protein